MLSCISPGFYPPKHPFYYQMKSISAYLLLLTGTLLLSGCLKENRDDCPVPDEQNLLLTFEYVDTEGKERLGECVDLIDVILFDHNHEFYRSIELRYDQLPEDRTLPVAVDPGTYYIISWGNNYSNREAVKNLQGSTLERHPSLIHSGGTSADPLFYAPDKRSISNDSWSSDLSIYGVTVAETGTTRHTVSFMGAHHIVNVYLRGFREIGNSAWPNPQIELANLASAYNYHLTPGEQNACFLQTAAEITPESELLGHARFFVPHFDQQSGVALNVTGENPSRPYELNLTMEYVLQELGRDFPKHGHNETIEVVVNWEDNLGIYITVPDWSVGEIDPGLDK